MMEAGVVAVLRPILRRRFTRRPLVSVVSTDVDKTVAMIPLTVRE